MGQVEMVIHTGVDKKELAPDQVSPLKNSS